MIDPSSEHAVQPPPELNPRREPVLDFPDKPLRDMTPDDYDRLGFMAGLEVHQQLLTSSKLFCRCSAGIRSETVHAEVLRHMRPTLSELGEYDRTALMEFKTRKEIVYQLDRATVCTYEMDDTPPFPMDEEAVAIAVELAELCNLNLVGELHVMRKQYLDGSIPTGFQRTAMVGLTGTIPLRVPTLQVDRELRIRQLSLEEDSCREVSDAGHRITFRTDRLGMPLTEVVTEPDLRTPWELQAAADLVARVARATGKVRRGAGTARQDVNVSVAGGRRVEIKGVPHHRGLPLLTHIEAFRQLNLLRVREALRERGVTREDLPDPPGGHQGDRAPAWDGSPLAAPVSPILRFSDFQPMRLAMERGSIVVAVKLPGFAGLLAHPTQPGLSFAHELSERIRVIACPAVHPFLTHTDARHRTLNRHHWGEIRATVEAGDGDAVVVLWAPEQDADTAVRELVIRAREALEGVPAETRQANPDMTTGFERLLPGPDRMYPDTDTPPLPIADGLVEEVRRTMGERPWERAARYEALGMDPAAADGLAGAPWADLFDAVAPGEGEPTRRLAEALARRVPFYARRIRTGDLAPLTPGPDPETYAGAPSPDDGVPPASRVVPLVRALEAGELLPEALVPALDAAVEAPDRGLETILSDLRPVADEEELEARARRAAAAPDGPVEPEARVAWAMGRVMAGLRGRVRGERVRERVEEAVAQLEAQPSRAGVTS